MKRNPNIHAHALDTDWDEDTEPMVRVPETLGQRFRREASSFIQLMLAIKHPKGAGHEPLLSDKPLSAEDFKNATAIETEGYEVK